MSWGIAETASEKEKIKADFADFLHGLNSTCEIDYNAYSQIFDYSMQVLDEMYEQGKKDANKSPSPLQDELIKEPEYKAENLSNRIKEIQTKEKRNG